MADERLEALFAEMLEEFRLVLRWFRGEPDPPRKRPEPRSAPREMTLPRPKPVLAVERREQEPLATPVVRIPVELRKRNDLQYLKIDPETKSVWCSCGYASGPASVVNEMNWWIVNHVAKGCKRPEAALEAEFNAVTASGKGA